MPIKIIVAGATGWTGRLVTEEILKSKDFQLVGAIARSAVGKDVSEYLGHSPLGVKITADLGEAVKVATSKPDILIDYTKPDSVRDRVLEALKMGMRAVVGTSGMAASDFNLIREVALQNDVGVIAAGNFSVTAALAKKFALEAARFLPTWEIIDYAHDTKVDAPSGTVRELAEELGEQGRPLIAVKAEDTFGVRETRGAQIGGSHVHSVRVPGYVVSFETLFGQPHERLTIRHDAGSGAEPYVAGTLLAAKKVMQVRGLIRGLDKILFSD